MKKEVSGASRTYVVCESGSRNVVGFYALATARKQAPGRISRQMPEPVPVAVLGRLAVGQRRSQERFSGRFAVFDLQAAAAWAKIQAEAEAAGKVMPVMDSMNCGDSYSERPCGGHPEHCRHGIQRSRADQSVDGYKAQFFSSL